MSGGTVIIGDWLILAFLLLALVFAIFWTSA